MSELDNNRYVISPIARDSLDDIGVITRGALRDPLTLSPPAPENKNQDWQLVRINRSTYQIVPPKSLGESDPGFSWAGGCPAPDAPVTFDKAKIFILTPVDSERVVYQVRLVDIDYYVGYNPESKEVQMTDQETLWDFAAIN